LVRILNTKKADVKWNNMDVIVIPNRFVVEGSNFFFNPAILIAAMGSQTNHLPHQVTANIIMDMINTTIQSDPAHSWSAKGSKKNPTVSLSLPESPQVIAGGGAPPFVPKTEAENA
jgi:hypothetical protein